MKDVADTLNGILDLFESNPADLVVWGASLAVVLIFFRRFQIQKRPGGQVGSKAVQEKKTGGIYGPRENTEPTVVAVDPDFKWDLEEPLKSYPFKNAEYKLTMGIRSLDFQDWLLVESSYQKVIEEKRKIITNTHSVYGPEKNTRDSTLFVTEEALPAIKEFYSVVTKYMCTKYPMYFVRDKENELIHNKITGKSIPLTCPEEMDTALASNYLEYLAETIEEDFIILLKDPTREHEQDGTEYFFKAGVFAFAAGFDPKDRFNMPLSFVHHPIPGYEQKLKTSMNRFFSRISPGQLVTRSNFSVQTHDKYFVDDSNKGHNLPKDHVQVPIDINSLDFDKQVHYRSERQSLTKLSDSGAVVFTIRTYLHPMSKIKNEGKEVSARLVGAIRGLTPEISQYKRAGEWGPPLIEYLERDD